MLSIFNKISSLFKKKQPIPQPQALNPIDMAMRGLSAQLEQSMIYGSSIMYVNPSLTPLETTSPRDLLINWIRNCPISNVSIHLEPEDYKYLYLMCQDRILILNDNHLSFGTTKIKSKTSSLIDLYVELQDEP